MAKNEKVTVTVTAGKIVLSGSKSVVGEVTGMLLFGYLNDWINQQVRKGKDWEAARTEAHAAVVAAQEKLNKRMNRTKRRSA